MRKGKFETVTRVIHVGAFWQGVAAVFTRGTCMAHKSVKNEIPKQWDSQGMIG